MNRRINEDVSQLGNLEKNKPMRYVPRSSIEVKILSECYKDVQGTNDKGWRTEEFKQ